jgi:hypothetical protein
MVEVVTPAKIVKARKEYRDDCAEWILAVLQELRSGDIGKLTFKEWRLIAESIRDHWKIQKGQLHQVVVCKMDGEIYSFRSKLGLAAICHKYELFADE